MKTRLLAILIAAATALTCNAQTVKTLGYGTNYAVIGPTNTLTWSNAFAWATNTTAAQTRTNIGLGSLAQNNQNLTFRYSGFGFDLVAVDEAPWSGYDAPVGSYAAGDSLAAYIKYGTNLTDWGTPLIIKDSGDIEYGNVNILTFTKETQFTGTNSTLITHLVIPDEGSIYFDGDASVSIASELTKSNARTALSLSWSSLTNTNAANFQSALFSTNTAPTNTTNAVGWMSIQIGTNTFRVGLFQ